MHRIRIASSCFVLVLAIVPSLARGQADAGVGVASEPPALAWGDAERRDWVFQAPARGSVQSLAWSGDGTRLAIASTEGFASVIEVASGEIVATHRMFSSSYMDAFRIALDEHGAHAYGLGSAEGAGSHTFLWDLATDRVVAHDGYLSGEIELSPDSTRGVVVDGTEVCTHRISNGREIRCAQVAGGGSAYWPSPRAIVVVGPRASGVSTLRVLDATRLNELFHLDGVSAWDVVDRTLAVRLADAVAILDAQTGAEQRRIALPAGGSSDVLLASDGTRLALASATSSTIVSLRSRRGAPLPPDVVLPGRVLWLDHARAIVDEGEETRRYVLPAGTRGMRLHSLASDGDELAWSSTGAVAGFHDDRVDIVGADGAVHTMTMAGEHSVWNARASDSGAVLEIDGRFGLDAWTADGVVVTACGRGSELVGDRLVEDGRECTLPRGTLVPYVQRLGGMELSARGVLTDASGQRVRLGDAVRRCSEELGDDESWHVCDTDLRLAAGGAIVINERSYQASGEEPETTRLFDAHTGRLLAELPAQHRVDLDPQARWAAASLGDHLSIVRLSDGATTFETDVRGSDAGGDLHVTPDGAHVVYRTASPRRVHVLDPITGREVRAVDARLPPELQLSGDAMILAGVEGDVLHVVDVATGTITDTAHVTGSATGLLCEGDRAFVLDPGPHALTRRDLGPCDPTDGTLTGGGRYVVFRSEGVVRVRRLSDGAELWLRSMRGSHVVHFAHDTTGRWWSDATGVVPMHVRSGHDGQLHPLSDEMRDPDLLRRFFAASSIATAH
jgi:hypothetical protein